MNLFDLIKIVELTEQQEKLFIFEKEWNSIGREIVSLCDCVMPDGTSTMVNGAFRRYCRFCMRGCCD